MQQNFGKVAVAVVPEPATMASVMLLLAARWRARSEYQVARPEPETR